MHTLLSDLRFAARRLRRAPGFTAAAVVTLGTAVGLVAVTLGTVDRVLVRPLAYRDPGRLVLVWRRAPSTGERRLAVPAATAAEIADRVGSFEKVGFVARSTASTLTDGAVALHAATGIVTGELFELLGVPPAVGRAFLPGEGIVPPGADGDSDGPLPPTAVVLSHRFWRERYGGDSSVVGRMVELDGQPAVVAGVTPPSFELRLPADAGMPSRVDVWTPLRAELRRVRRADAMRDQDSDDAGIVVARLRADATMEQAAAELAAVAETEPGARLSIHPLQAEVVRAERPVLLALAVATTLLLVVACVNVAHLLLLRTAGRARELAIRSALGATRRRLVRLVTAESAVLAAGAGAAGALVALWGEGALSALAPTTPTGSGPEVLRLVAGSAALGAAAALGCGLVAAAGAVAATHGAPAARLRLAGRAASRGGGSVRRAAVVAQVGLALVLLVMAGLLVRSVAALAAVDPGFRPDGVLAFSLSLRGGDPRYRGPGDRARLIGEIEGRLTALPGVRAVGVTGGLPLGGREWTSGFGLDGEAPAAWQAREADYRTVTPGYFAAMDVRLLAGRAFSDAETRSEARRVAVVDDSVAALLGGATAALGRAIGFPLDGRPVQAEVVGVVRRVRHARLREPGRGTIYVPYRQEASRDVSVVLRADGDPEALVGPVRRVVAEVAPALPPYDVRPMSAYVAASTASERLALVVIGGLAVTALLLAALGVYAVLDETVASRTRDIGIRVALGARSGRVVGDVVRATLSLAAAGVALGIVPALAAARVLGPLLYGIGPFDAASLAVAAASLAAVALLAAWLPARRAGRVDPMVVLRGD